MKHNHHLVPRHLGGTDDKSNIVENISVTRHAMFHYANWLLYKSDGDFADYNIVKDNTFTGSDRTVKDDGENNTINGN
jgi:hypothetical protein